jgi:hypothetical protein
LSENYTRKKLLAKKMLKNEFLGLLSVETPEKPPKVIESS